MRRILFGLSLAVVAPVFIGQASAEVLSLSCALVFHYPSGSLQNFHVDYWIDMGPPPTAIERDRNTGPAGSDIISRDGNVQISPEKIYIDGLEINRMTGIGSRNLQSAGFTEGTCVKSNEPIPSGAPSLGTKF
jgi:hypothetical protein